MNIRDDLKALVDNELSPERAAEVQAAIDNDPALREEVVFMKQLSGEISSAAHQPQVKGLDKAMGRVVKPRPAWTRLTLYSAGGVAVVFLVGAIFFPVFAQSKAAAKKASQRYNDSYVSSWGSAAEDSASSTPAETKSESLSDGFSGSTSDQGRVRAGGELNRRLSGGGKGDPMVKSKWRAQFSTQPAAPKTIFEPNRKVIRTADVGLKVQDVSAAVQETERAVMAMGGIVGQTNFDSALDSARATIEFQIPVKNFSAILDAVSKLGQVVRKTTTGQDVTAQVADTDGRIKALADEESNLISELRRARSSDVRLEIRSRLSYVRQEIAGLKAQNEQMKGLADMSQVTVGFEQAGQLDESKADDWFNQTTGRAGDALGFFGRVFGVGLIYTLFLAPVWAPIAGLVWWLRKRATRVSG